MSTEIARAWSDRGYAVTIVTLAPAETDFYKLDPRISRISLLFPAEYDSNPWRRGWANLARAHAVRRVLRQVRPDIVLGMTTLAAILVALASFGLKVKAFGSERIHPPTVRLGAAEEWARRIGYRLLTGVICQTEQSAAWVRENTWAREVRVVPNLVVLPLPKHEPVLPTQAVPPERKLLLGVGRLDLQKQFGKLIHAFSRVAPGAPDWDLVILGDGSEREELENQVRDLGLADRVSLPGAAGNVSDWYERADIYALSSAFEGFPNSLLEAMAHGVAPIAFDCPTGPADMITAGDNGLLVPLDDMEGLTRALSELMSDDALRSSLGERAHRVRETFGERRIIERWLVAFGEADRL